MKTFDYHKLSFENRSIIYQIIDCTKFSTLNKVLDKFLIYHNHSQLQDKEKEKILFQIWLQEVSKISELKKQIKGESTYIDNLIINAGIKYNITTDLDKINYLKINSPRQDYYDSLQSNAYKRISLLSKIISVSKDFSYSYSEKDHAYDSSKIAERLAHIFNLSSHSIYHLKSITIDHSFGEIALGKSGALAFEEILQKYDINKNDFQFNHHHNVMRHLIAENASFSRINAATSNIVKPNNTISESELLKQYPYEIQNLCKKLSMIGIFNGSANSYLNNFSNFESQIMNWSDGISWVTNDLKLMLKLEFYQPTKLAQEIDFIKDIYNQTTQKKLDTNRGFIDEFVEDIRQFLIIDYANTIKLKLYSNNIKERSITHAEDIRYAKYPIGYELSDKLQGEVYKLIEIISDNLYEKLLYTKGKATDGCIKKELWFELLSLITEKILYFYQNNIALPNFYQELLEKNINYIFTVSYRDNLNNTQNIIIAIIKFLGIDLTDRESLRLCDLILRNENSSLKEFFGKYKLNNIYDLQELLSEF